MAQWTLAICLLLIHVTNCLWTLDVTVLVIDMKHSEKRNGSFCCCDNDPCQNSLSDLETCAPECDVLLNVTVSPCTESTSPRPCSVTTERIKDAENYSDYGYFFHFTTSARANNLTIVMEDQDISNDNDLIAEFTIALSLFGANVVTFTGEEQIATISLSYEIHCMNLPDCPTPSPTPTSSVICADYHDAFATDEIALNKTPSSKASIKQSTETVRKTAVLTSTLPYFPHKDKSISTILVTALPTSVEDEGQLCQAELLWMIAAIFAMVLAMIGAGTTVLCSVMYFKKRGHTPTMSLKPSATIDISFTENEAYSLVDHGKKPCCGGTGNSVDKEQAKVIYETVHI